MRQQTRQTYEFGPFRLDPMKRVLLRDSRQVQLTPKAFDTLLALVEASGQLLEKDALMQRVWPDSFVEEGSLTVNISTLRKVLGDNRGYIVTVPGRGYRFVADVREVLNAGGEFIVEEAARTYVVIEESTLPVEIADRVANAPHPRRLRWTRLRVTAAVCLSTLVLAGSLYSVYFRGPTIKRIAVLPFKPLDANNDESYLSLGLADALITKLGNIRKATICPTSAVRKYLDQEQDPLAAGQQLKVDAIVQGSVQRVHERVRVNIQVIRVADGAILWSNSYVFRHDLSDIFQVQDTISAELARALALTVSGEEQN